MNSYQLYSEYLFAKAGFLGIPLSGTFELTARCNLDCRMCYIHKRSNDAAAKRRELDTAQWLRLAKDCQQAGMLNLLLTGGEPLLRPDFREIYTGCRELGLMVSINSNATLIRPDMAAFLAANPPARINVSLYGSSPQTYETLCGNPSAYHQTVNAILALKEAGVSVKLNYSITPYNRKDADGVYAFAREHELPIQVATYMYPPVRACEYGCFTSDRMTAEESAEAQMHYDQIRFTPEELRHRLEQQLAGIRIADPNKACPELPTEHLNCRAGSSTFWITWDGQMRLCGMMTEPSVNLSQGFQAAWEAIRAARETIFVPSECSACEVAHVCDQCPALCHAETGSFTEAPAYMCSRTRAYLNLARKIIDSL